MMAANGTTHTIEKATVSICDLDMFCSRTIIERITRGTFVVLTVRRLRLYV